MAAKAPKALADMQLTAVRTLTSVLPAPGLQSSVSGSTATLSWIAPTPSGQSIIAGYRLYKASAVNGPFALVNTYTTLSTTDTLSGTQFYRIEAFDQYQTGVSSSVVSCAPQVSSGPIKPFMGHWIYVDQGVSKDAQFTRTQQLVARCPHVAGFQYLWKWGVLENPNVPGDYSGNWAAAGQAGFQLVHRFADYLRSVGKKMHLNNFSYGGNIGINGPGSINPNNWLSSEEPIYLSDSAYGPNTPSTNGIWGGMWMSSYPGASFTQVKSFMRFWVPAVGARLLALSQAYGAEFDSHDGFGIFSPLSESTMDSRTSYTVAADKLFFLGTNNNGAFAQMRAHWPTTPLRWWGNFMGNSYDDMSDMIDGAVANKWIVGGPDTLNDPFDSANPAWAPAWSAATSYIMGQVVSRSNVNYYCSTANTNSPPPSGNWTTLNKLTRTIASDFVWRGCNGDNTVNANYNNWVGQGARGDDVEPLDLDVSHDDGVNFHHVMHANKLGSMALFWYDLRYNSSGTTPSQNRTDTPSPNLLDWIESCAQGGNVNVNGIVAGIKLTNDGLYPPTWGSALAAPADLWVEFQGKTSYGGDDGSAGVALAPNTQVLSWLAVPGATSYNLYRSVNNGAEVLYASGIPGTSYTDTAATGCVNGTAGPVNGVYYPANTYRYRVAAVAGSAVGLKTATGQKYYVFHGSRGGQNTVGGYKWWGDFNGANNTNSDYNNTGTPNVTGKRWYNTPVGASAYILPVCGGIDTHWNCWIKSIGSTGALYIDILKTDVTTSLGLHGEIIGDLVMPSTGVAHPNQPANLDMQAYLQNGPIVANQFFTYRIPIAVYMTPKAGWGFGNGSSTSIDVLQYQVYKFLIQINGGNQAPYALDNVYFGE